MRINVISKNRQHLLDLAQGLNANGCDVMFYTLVSHSRCIRFGLSKKICKSYFFKFFPYILYGKLRRRSPFTTHLQKKFGEYVIKNMRNCDVIIINGYGLCFTADDYVTMREKFGAIIILEWGSKHIIEQRKAINALESYPKELYDLAKAQYDIADIISIPSLHVKESFLKHGIPEKKIFVNPYGANLNIFQPTMLDSKNFDLIMVGNWSFLKGCDYIEELCKRYNYTFLHVGCIGDLPFPCDVASMHHVDAVNEYELPKYYAKGKVFILLSRTEGLALVQAQAMACGLPIVCSKNTGGIDLAKLSHSEEYLFEIDDYKLESIHECVEKALAIAQKQPNVRCISNDLSKLSWDRYGKCYINYLNKWISSK